MSTIKLNNGKLVLIDNADFELCSAYSWYYQGRGLCEYVCTEALVNGVRRRFYMHQLVMGTVGTSLKVDHRNRNGLDNRRKNLRIASHSDNMKNRRKHRGSSRFTGVSRHGSKWVVHINIEGKCTHVGLFSCEKKAALAYNRAARATGNPFYNLNKVY